MKNTPAQLGETICWYCRNACPDREEDNTRGCSWSRHFEPVEGWVAIQTKLKYYYRLDPRHKRTKFDDTSYVVKSCPLFEPG